MEPLSKGCGGGTLELRRLTLRQDILHRLRAGPVTLRELGRELNLREKEVAEHLSHAIRSLGPGESLRDNPAVCLACGFTFRKRDRVQTPGRCPRCRSERIEPGVFWIEPSGR